MLTRASSRGRRASCRRPDTGTRKRRIRGRAAASARSSSCSHPAPDRDAGVDARACPASRRGRTRTPSGSGPDAEHVMRRRAATQFRPRPRDDADLGNGGAMRGPSNSNHAPAAPPSVAASHRRTAPRARRVARLDERPGDEHRGERPGSGRVGLGDSRDSGRIRRPPSPGSRATRRSPSVAQGHGRVGRRRCRTRSAGRSRYPGSAGAARSDASGTPGGRPDSGRADDRFPARRRRASGASRTPRASHSA
ncbi:MAG: hypothetical protein MZV64_43060 [Ignavibacteriales bacterium]|nr:hypothetical protein [Ignavibacteriales bacterium]